VSAALEGLPEPRERAKHLRDGGMRCHCDLDNWEPSRITGHSHVCPIHKAVMAERGRALLSGGDNGTR
jgi:hypothetical protein